MSLTPSRSDTSASLARYPLLEALLTAKGLELKGIYTIRDAAQIFGTSVRTIQDWVRDGKLVARDLPGRGRFLSEDLESFLQESVRRREERADLSAPVHDLASKRHRVPTDGRKRRRHV